MIAHRHSLAAQGTHGQTLQQSRTLARRALLTFCAKRLGVFTQALDILLELLPGNVGVMRIANERSPFLGRKSYNNMVAVGTLSLVRAPIAECSSVARMVQDPQHA